MQHFTLCHEVVALLRADDVQRAQEEVRRFETGIAGNRRYRVTYLHAQGMIAGWLGEIEQAIAFLQAALLLSDELGLPCESFLLSVTLGKLFLMTDQQQAQKSFDRAEQLTLALGQSFQDEQTRHTFFARAAYILKHPHIPLPFQARHPS